MRAVDICLWATSLPVCACTMLSLVWNGIYFLQFYTSSYILSFLHNDIVIHLFLLRLLMKVNLRAWFVFKRKIVSHHPTPHTYWQHINHDEFCFKRKLFNLLSLRIVQSVLLYQDFFTSNLQFFIKFCFLSSLLTQTTKTCLFADNPLKHDRPSFNQKRFLNPTKLSRKLIPSKKTTAKKTPFVEWKVQKWLFGVTQQEKRNHL